MEPPDGELVRIIGSAPDTGTKNAALELLRERHEVDMLRQAQSVLNERQIGGLEAQDVVQEVFAEVLLTVKLGQFDESRPLRPWLMAVVRNKARDLLRYERPYTPIEEEVVTLLADKSQTEAQEQVQELLGQLDPDDRKLFEGFYLEDRSAGDLALEQGTEPTKVYRELHRIRNQLRATNTR